MRKCLNITYPFNIFIFYSTCIGILQCKNHIKQSLLNDIASDNFINEIYYIWSSWYIQRGLRVYLIKCVHQRRIGLGSNQTFRGGSKNKYACHINGLCWEASMRFTLYNSNLENYNCNLYVILLSNFRSSVLFNTILTFSDD